MRGDQFLIVFETLVQFHKQVKSSYENLSDDKTQLIALGQKTKYPQSVFGFDSPLRNSSIQGRSMRGIASALDCRM